VPKLLILRIKNFEELKYLKPLISLEYQNQNFRKFTCN